MEVGVDAPHRSVVVLGSPCCCPNSKSSGSCSSSSCDITPYLDEAKDQGNGNEKEKGNSSVV